MSENTYDSPAVQLATCSHIYDSPAGKRARNPLMGGRQTDSSKLAGSCTFMLTCAPYLLP